MYLIDQLFKLGPILYVIMGSFEQILLKFVVWDKFLDSIEMQREPVQNIFDFIIVGGGSAGCPLANRLSVDYEVLLLEAGGLPSAWLDLPIISYYLNNQKPVDWAHRTVPQKHAAWGLNNNVSHWPAGKQLGGSSTINGLINIRGNVQGFDDIADRTGDPRWKMKNVLPYYKALEDYHGYFDDGTHGKGGTMGIQKADLMPFTSNLLRAGVELGYKIRDPNPNDGPNTEGFAPMEFYLKFGRRSDSFKEDLKPLMNRRKNLHVRKFSFVTKIIFKGNQAVGVEYERHGQQYKAFVKKEVILSAGSIHTPKILMLSGIGPRQHLEEVGIKPFVDLPVGGSLQDKYGTLVGPFLVADKQSFLTERDITPSVLLQWYTQGTGIFSAGRTEATHAILTDYAKREGRLEVPDIHTYVLSASADHRMELDFAKAFNFNKKSLAFFVASRGRDSFFQLVTNSRPRGTGYIKLRDKNPKTPLIIDPKYFEDEQDVTSMVEGIKFAVKLVEETKAFKEINGELMPIHFPGCENYIFKSDAYYECLARHSTITAYKYCGTAPIGKDTSDKRAVVDSKLRVFSTKGLRVVDGSVLQLFYTSENDVTVRVIGQIGADIILEDWKPTYTRLYTRDGQRNNGPLRQI